MTVREFNINGVSRTDHTYRTALIQHFAPVTGRSVLDVGAADGYESRAAVFCGARRVVAVEGKDAGYHAALAAQAALKLPGLEVRQLDARRIDEHGLGTFDVVFCFGFLYHMENPFNVLKRLRRVTRGRLLIETHVAPATLVGLLPKHAHAVPFDSHTVALDGVPFTGKIVRHRGDHAVTIGSLDAPWSFWLDPESLLNAIVRAGFSVSAYYHRLDETCPPVVQQWGGLLGFGHANTKAWVCADPTGEVQPIMPATEEILSGQVRRDTVAERLRRAWLTRFQTALQ